MLPRPNPADVIVISDDEDAPLAPQEPRRKSRATAAIPFADPSVIFDLNDLPDLRLVREAYHRDGYVVLRALDAALVYDLHMELADASTTRESAADLWQALAFARAHLDFKAILPMPSMNDDDDDDPNCAPPKRARLQ